MDRTLIKRWTTRSRRPPPAYMLRCAFTLAIVPTARLMRLFGIDRLGLRARPDVASHWSRRDPKPIDLNSQV